MFQYKLFFMSTKLLKDEKINDGSDNEKQTRLNARLESEANAAVIGGRDGNSRNYAGARSGQVRTIP